MRIDHRLSPFRLDGGALADVRETLRSQVSYGTWQALAAAEQGLPSVLPNCPSGVNGQNGPGDGLAFVGSQEGERV
jgi:hypothetical protein